MCLKPNTFSTADLYTVGSIRYWGRIRRGAGFVWSARTSIRRRTLHGRTFRGTVLPSQKGFFVDLRCSCRRQQIMVLPL
jgi:hypothetical protein